jgi:hypothetical protein
MLYLLLYALYFLLYSPVMVVRRNNETSLSVRKKFQTNIHIFYHYAQSVPSFQYDISPVFLFKISLERGAIHDGQA